MANVLGLALKITGDASGLRLDPAQRALQRLGDETDKVSAIFDKFTGDSEAAGRAQATFERQARELLNTLRDGGSATEFARNFERIAEAARAEAAALQEAARITESVRTPLERFGQSANELASQLEAGRISQETYNRALEQSTRGLTNAELAASGLAAVDLERLQSLRLSAAAEAIRVETLQRGAQITASLQTDEEKRAARLNELGDLLATGAISEETYTRAIEQASGVQEAAARAEQERQRVLQEGQRITDRFATSEERRGQELANLQRLLDAGAISEETFARALAEASGANEAAARAERERADALAAASRIIQANLTPQERYDQQVQELQGHLEAGRLSQDQFNRALEQSTRGLTNAELAASGLAAADLERLQSLRDAAIAEGERVEALRKGAALTAALQTDEEKRAARLAELDNLLTTGAISEETYTRAVEQASGVQEAAARAEQERQRVLQEGQRITDRFATTEERRGQELANLQRLLDAGAISEETFARASAEASGANEAAARAERERADALAAASRIIQANLTPLERYDAQLIELQGHLEAGRLTQEQFNRASAQAASGLSAAERASRGLAVETEAIGDAAQAATLQFNELSGIFAILPGPLGNIAGRLSGLTSASQGLSRVFSGGLQQGITAIAGSVTSLINPFTLAAGAVVGLGAAANSVARGLLSLEDRVERLGNQANQLGVSFGFIQTLEESARRSGVSVGSLEGAFTRLQRTISEAGEGTKTATDALARLGLTVEQIDTLDQEEQFRLIGERIAAIEDPARRTAAAVEIFGRSGAQLLPFFANLPGAANDLERLGRAITDREKSQVDAFGASVDALGVATQGLGQSILLPFAGIGDGIASAAAEFTAGITAIIDPIGRVLEPALTQIGRAVEIIGIALGGVGRIIGAVFAPFGDLVQQVAGFLEPLNNGIVDLVRFLADAAVSTTEFVESFAPISLISAGIERLSGVTSSLSDAFSFLSDIGSRLARIVSVAFTQIGEVINATIGRAVTITTAAVDKFLEFSGLGNVIAVFATAVSTAFNSLLENIQGVIARVGGFIESIVKFAEDWLGIVATIEEPIVPELDAGQLSVELSDELAKAQESVAQFGNAGVEAFLEYKAQLDEIAQLVEEGEYDGEAQARAIEQATRAFEAQAQTLAEQAQEEIARLNEENRIELEIQTSGLQALEGLRRSISEVIDESTALGQAGFDAALQYQNSLGELQRQFEQGVINEEVLAREAKAAREEYDAQVDAIEASVAAQNELIANDRRRIESLLQVNDAAQRITDDIGSVDREIARVQDELARATVELDAASADSARRRLVELEGLQTRLADDLQAAAQGFENGFDAAFQATGNNFAQLAEQAAEFGQAGVDAAARLQEGIAAAQEQARDGILNREAFEAEVARRQRLFEQEIEQVRQVADERQRVNEFVDQQFLLARFGGDQQRLDAANRAAEIEREIIRVQQDVQAARAAGDQAAVNAGIQRLGLLDQVGARERDIATGRRQFEEQIAQQREQYLQQIAEQQKQAEEQQKKFAEERAKAVEAENQRQQARLRELNTLGSGVIEGNDIRTAEGAALFLQLAANRQDPALIEARLQTRRLTEIRQEVRALVEGLTGLPVLNIAGGAG